jgi:hypothetical protein
VCVCVCVRARACACVREREGDISMNSVVRGRVGHFPDGGAQVLSGGEYRLFTY